MLLDLLSHLSQEDRARIENLDNEILTLQENCQNTEDTLKLSKLYAERSKIIAGG